MRISAFSDNDTKGGYEQIKKTVQISRKEGCQIVMVGRNCQVAEETIVKDDRLSNLNDKENRLIDFYERLLLRLELLSVIFLVDVNYAFLVWIRFSIKHKN